MRAKSGACGPPPKQTVSRANAPVWLAIGALRVITPPVLS
jgi:hypothetical protein